MTQMLFFLRFKAQLRRTRPDTIFRLEKSVTGAVEAAGGKITGERRLLAASFDENALGFWLDMLLLIENALQSLDRAAGDLYGYALVLGRDMEEDSAERICRLLSGGRRGGGVWLDTMAKKGLSPYAIIDKNDFTAKEGRSLRPQDRALIQGFVRLEGLKNFSGVRPHCFPLDDTIQRALAQNARRNAVLLGPDFSGKRHGIYRFYQDLFPAQAAGEVSPLIIRFDTGGISCLADALTPRLHALIAGSSPREMLEELDLLGTALFRDRLRDEISPGGVQQGRRFFRLLLEAFVPAAKKRGAPPLIILENIHRADADAARIFLDAYAAFPGKQGLLILGTCSDEAPDVEDQLKFWGGVFPRVIKLNAGDISGQEAPDLPPDLEETGYALALLGRFFPGTLFPRLFEEAGKTPAMLSRALLLLAYLGFVDTPDDPRPRIGKFMSRMDRAPGARKEKIRAMTRNRLLDWVGRNRLNPCFRLLEALAELGGTAGDELILQSISSDLINGTYAGIDRALAEKRLEKIAGAERVEAVRFIIKTHKALYHGDERAIRAAFQDVPPDCAFSPVLKAQVLANLSAFHLGSRDIGSAGETVKEGILLSQGKSGAVLAQSYRLFSLVNIFRQRMGETLDYLGFAVDHAGKSGNSHELVISAYYAASAHFLFGNISRAQRLAVQAETEALVSGNNDWADRSRFLRGRLWFETGRYREALEIFEALSGNSAGQREKEGLLAAWTYRAKVYLQHPLLPKPAGGCPDADLFEIEAAYL
ncbi:MAG: ATP-binding protein, partial [Treponema sp.]|nr:ATP-binding protein [Treponema sp.]